MPPYGADLICAGKGGESGLDASRDNFPCNFNGFYWCCSGARRHADPKPGPSAKPAQTAVKPEGIAPVSKSPLPTFYGNTYQRIASAMLSYTTVDLRGGWPALPKTAQLAPGASVPESSCCVNGWR